jgi:hypothetical protein
MPGVAGERVERVAAKCMRLVLVLWYRNVITGLSKVLQLTPLYLKLFELLKYVLLIYKARTFIAVVTKPRYHPEPVESELPS